MLNFQTASINLTKGLETKDDELLAEGNDVMQNVDMSKAGTPRKRHGLKAYPATVKIGLNTVLEDSFTPNNVIEAYPSGQEVGVSTNNSNYVFSREIGSYYAPGFISDRNEDSSYPLLACNKREVYSAGSVVGAEGEVAWAENSLYKVQYKFGTAVQIIKKDNNSKTLPFDAGVGIQSACFTVLDDVIYYTAFSPGPDFSLGRVDGDGYLESIATIDDGAAVVYGDTDRNHHSLCNDGEFLYVATWMATSDTPIIKVRKLNTSGTVLATYEITKTTDNDQRGTPIEIRATENYVAVVFNTYIDSTTTAAQNLFVLNKDLTLNNSYEPDDEEYQGSNIFAEVDAKERIWIMFSLKPSVSGSASSQLEFTRVYVIGLATGSLEGSLFSKGELSFAAYSRPYIIDDRMFVLAKWRNDTDENKVIFDYGVVTAVNEGDFKVCALIEKGVSIDWPLAQYDPFFMPSDFSFDQEVITRRNDPQVGAFTITSDRSSTGAFVEAENTTYLPGAMVSVFDGKNVFPAGFTGRPEIVSHTTESGDISAGDYDYIAIYVRTDAKGNVYRSRESNKYELTLGSSLQVNLILGKFGFDETVKDIELYRKLRTETVYRFVGKYAQASTISDNTDNLSERKTLYTTGDIIESEQPPALIDITSHENRIFGISLDNRVYFSQPSIRGEGFVFSDFQFINIDENQGRRSQNLKAVVGLDNKLIVFKENSIFAIFGNGPDNTGANNDFTLPELITTDVGCNSPRSIVLNSGGVYFKGEKGIYQLTRGTQLSFVGADVDRFRDEIITSAVLLEESNRVVFTTKSGVGLVHNYNRETWTTYTNFDAVSAFMSNDRFLMFKSDATAWEEKGDFDDDGAFIEQKMTTNWLNIAGIQGFQRIQKLFLVGRYKGDHTMKVRVYYDYEDYAWDEYILTPIDANYNESVKPDLSEYQNGVNNGVFQWNIHLKKQKCQAIKIEIFDEQRGATPTEAFFLSNITAKIGVKKGLFKGTDTKAV